MPWLISFIVCWIVFFLLRGHKWIKRTWAAGIFAVALELNVDYRATIYGLFEIKDRVVSLLDSSVFFTFGAVPAMSMLFVQYLPRKNKWLRLVNILIWALIFLIYELVVANNGGLVHIKWSYYDSFIVNIASFTMLSWLGENFLIFKEERG